MEKFSSQSKAEQFQQLPKANDTGGPSSEQVEAREENLPPTASNDPLNHLHSITYNVEVIVRDQILRADLSVLLLHNESIARYLDEEKERIFLPDTFDPEAVKAVIDYVNNENLPTTDEQLTSLVKAAADLEMYNVVNKGLQILWSRIAPSNALIFGECAAAVGNALWSKYFYRYIRQHFEDIVIADGFPRTPFAVLKILICRHAFPIKRADHLLEAVLRWAKASAADRRACLPELLRDIPIHLLPSGYIFRILANEVIIQESPVCAKAISDGRNRGYFLNRAKRNTDIMEYLQDPELADCGFYTVYGAETGETVVCYYSALTNVWGILDKRQFQSLPSYVLFVGTELHLIGNYSIDVLDLSESRLVHFMIKGDTSTPDNAGIVSHGGKIYFFGDNSTSRAKSILRLDLETLTYLDVGTMMHTRADPGVVSLELNVYVTGGYYAIALSSSERYDPKTQVSTLIAPMRRERYGHGCDTLRGNVYVCGGRTTGERCELFTNTAEVYDPLTDQWTLIENMNNEPLCRISLFGLGNNLLAIDADPDDDDRFQIRIYDTDVHNWSDGGQIRNYGKHLTIVKTKIAAPLGRP